MQDAEVEEGDRIRVRKDTDSGTAVYEGVFMPTASKNIVLKLDSGYNIGIRPQNVEIKLVSRAGVLREHGAVEAPEAQRTGHLPKLSILSTGGTIASKVDYRTGAVSPQFTTADILEAIPELGQIATITGKVVYSILSENMRAAYWQRLAAEVYAEIQNGADGIIVTHGTDTMGYTAAALAFMVQTPVPIVLVGSQRSSDRPSSDASMNAICAAKVATSDIAEVVVVMHGSTSDDFCFIHRGTKVRKMHTSARTAFRSINDEPIGRVRYSTSDVATVQIEAIPASYVRRGERELVLRDALEARCALIKFFPGEDPGVLEYFVGHGYKGLVVEGTGLGHVSAEWIPGIRSAVERGIPVVMTSQCLYGTICDRVYDTGRDLLTAGIIEAEDMLPETALVKLMWVLGQTQDMASVRQKMQENIAGEIKGRRMP
ncbi:MAG TPA: Glu-tRNA(Gln) amidotransferase subunit GatD [Methanomicrobia archaeon]|nr:Glu-tRNA(Gln) amidotransferase subunit GatD [Methanomicrobia archaeon]